VTSPAVALPVGTNRLVGEFIGDASFYQDQAELLQTVFADKSVEATGLAVSPTTFYPVVDGYRDTISIKGTTLEPATVTIRIFNSKGSLVRSLALGSRSGAFSTTWNGKNSSGTLLAAGTYKVQHRLQDTKGNVLYKSTPVTLSWRKVKWVAASSTRYGTAYATTLRGGTGTISRTSSFTSGLRVAGGSSSSGYAVARYSFTLRSALAYKGLKIQVLGKGTRSTSRAILAFAQDQYGSLVGPAYQWWSRSGGITGHVNNRVVLLDVETDGPMSGAFDIAKTKVSYYYAVWP
jgi:hypothetical protein